MENQIIRTSSFAAIYVCPHREHKHLKRSRPGSCKLPMLRCRCGKIIKPSEFFWRKGAKIHRKCGMKVSQVICKMKKIRVVV